MSETKHTPGPWKFLIEVGRIEGGVTGESPVAYVAGRPRKFGSHDLKEAHYNGALIAAAPELLKTLEHMVAVSNWATTIQSEEQYDAMIASAEAAIRKAKGE